MIRSFLNPLMNKTNVLQDINVNKGMRDSY